MGMSVQEERRLWVKRVLDFELAVAAPANAMRVFNDRWTKVRLAWGDSAAAATDQITALCTALRATAEPDLVIIADKGFADITARIAALNAAIGQIDRTTASKLSKSAVKLQAELRGARPLLTADARIAASDSNPFGVQVKLAKTLDPVLMAMDKVLATAA